MTQINFNESTDSVMIRRSGYPLWIENLSRTDANWQDSGWQGRVVSMTHPTFEMGDTVSFTASEVRDKE